MDMFAEIIKAKKVREGVTAYQYRNGIVNIEGQKYAMHSMTSAINKFRKDFPVRRNAK